MNLNCSNSSQITKPDPGFIAASTVMGLCFVLGVPGNVAALWILAQRLKNSSFTIKLMLSLAISDLLILLPLPLWIWSLLHEWIFSSPACKIIAFIEYWGVYCSALGLTLMSVQRYLHVLHPQKWVKLGKRGENVLLSGIWILSGVLCSYAPVQFDVKCNQDGVSYCYQQFKQVPEEVGILFFEILILGMCVVLLVLFYCLLYRGVNQSLFFNNNRLTQLVARILLSFFICYSLTPIANVVSIVKVLVSQTVSPVTDDLGVVVRALTFVNSCVNPFLYAFSLRTLHSSSPLVEHP